MKSMMAGGLAVLVLSGVLAGAAGAQAAGGTGAGAVQASAGTSALAAPKDSARAELTYAEALQQAKEKDLKLLIDFSAEH